MKVGGMELAFPTTIRIPTLSNPNFKSKNPVLFFNPTPFKTNLSSSRLFSNTPFSPSENASIFSFPTNALSSSSTTTSTVTDAVSPCTHWVVVMEKPPNDLKSKSEVVDHYVKTLARVLGCEREAQMCIYDASWQTHFGFCCDIDEVTSHELAGLPGVLSVRPDTDFDSVKKDYSVSNLLLGHLEKSNGGTSQLGNLEKSNGGTSQLSSVGDSKYWLLRMEKPSVEVVSKAQMVDYYAQTLTKVFGNEKDAQMCIYNISWQNNFGFCCEIDEGCARELAGVPGVLSVQPDTNFGSENKDYGGGKLTTLPDPSDTNQTPMIKTKRLFVTGLSFYTSEKTLRAAFEGFGELVELKIIMDKISKRSKGYAFIEYTTEESASVALKEMNGKIINGWMIVVDVAKTNPPRFNRDRQRPAV